MSNAEQVAYNNMLREIEGLSYGGDVQDDEPQWIDVKKQLPEPNKMAWVAVKNAFTCAYETRLAYRDDNDNWWCIRNVNFPRAVMFWQYADVPECNVSC